MRRKRQLTLLLWNIKVASAGKRGYEVEERVKGPASVKFCVPLRKVNLTLTLSH